jgi:hypothetical protein
MGHDFAEFGGVQFFFPAADDDGGDVISDYVGEGAASLENLLYPFLMTANSPESHSRPVTVYQQHRRLQIPARRSHLKRYATIYDYHVGA